VVGRLSDICLVRDHKPQLYRRTGRIKTVNMLSRDGRVWRCHGIDPKALLAALILDLTSSEEPSNEPSSLTDRHEESSLEAVRY